MLPPAPPTPAEGAPQTAAPSSALAGGNSEATEPAKPTSPLRLIGEFLLVGGGTLLLLPLLSLSRITFGLEPTELAVGFLTFHAALIINDPHFAVTYVLFYRSARRGLSARTTSTLQRWRYWIAGVVVPAALVATVSAAVALRSAALMGGLLQAMFFLVHWHYVKQAFGVAALLSARYGVALGTRERRWLLLHCFAAWAYAWAAPADLGRDYIEHGVVFHSFAHPPGLDVLASTAFYLSLLGLLWMCVGSIGRLRQLRGLLPIAAMLITIWLWTVFAAIEPLMAYVIPALHSLQYLYFVTLRERKLARAHAGPPNFESVSKRLAVLGATAVGLGWLLLSGAPGFLDTLRNAGQPGAQDALGPTPFLAGFVALVNIHHYFMDTVIWRRENPEMRYVK